ncbi:hypothetical protein B0H12DRAFT_1149738 [Mycena haematopus]|nr:hypothetical protein B0H12DRAFT_1149738 [Mycena haematopus]
MPAVTGIGLASVTNAPNLFPTLPSVISASASSVATPVSSAVSVTAQSFTVDPTTTNGVNAVNTFSPAAATAGTSFFQNKTALIGVCAGAGALLIILLACLTACIRRRNRRCERERQRKLDREISVSYRTTMKQAAESWRPPPSLNPSMTRSRANSMYSTVSESSGSHGAYAQPPLPVTQQPPNYDAAPRRRNEDWRATMAVVDVAVRGTMVEPHIVQPQRAQMYPTGPAQSGSRHAQRPSQSADIHLSVLPQAPPAIYLSHSALSSPPADAAAPPYTSPAAEMPLTPTPLPNPFDQQQQQRGRERPTSDIPITPTPFPNPFDRQLQAKQVLTTPVSPAPWLPNPYAADE